MEVFALFGSWRIEPPCVDSAEPLLKSLAETIAWCQPRFDIARPGASLRSEALRPRVLEPSYFAAVSSVIANRHLALDPSPLAPVRVPGGGRLLLYYPDAELADGAAEAETGRYFDVNNAPPWDTWVGLIGPQTDIVDDSYAICLIAWVPTEFLGTVARGIRVNPEGSLEWLEDAQGEAAGFLRKVMRVLVHT